MSSASLGQLKYTYTQVVETTLQLCDVSDLPAATLLALAERWRSVLARRLLEMQEKEGLGPPEQVHLEAPDVSVVFSSYPKDEGDTSGFTLLGTCVDMVVPPPALTEAQRTFPTAPALKSAEDLPALPFEPAPGTPAPGRPSKRKRPGTPSATISPGTPRPPPLAVLNAQAGHLSPVLQSVQEEDEQFAGCFDDAEVILQSPPPQEVVQRADGSGSELGSDLDDVEELFVPDALIFTKVARVRKNPKRWSVRLKEGVLRVNDLEMLFASGQMQLDLPEAPQATLEPSGDQWNDPASVADAPADALAIVAS
ncbi:unnamed protein product [Durusdinium trenchii]|uniref:Condensin complex subunit 2 n=3 Tax=Durusdinium trenchii TaxID=1381693 RepID=A0ABP0I471_9DINO